MAIDSDHGAFVEKFLLRPPSSSPDLPLSGLTFATKDIFDVAGRVTGFGNPDWARTHPAAESTAPVVSAILSGGATSIGITVTAEMAYSLDGENKHYGTPKNPCAPDRVPGGSSSGSAVAVAAGLADFSLGWFARNPAILNRVGRVLLQLPDTGPVVPTQLVIAEDCFQISSVPSSRVKQALVDSVEKLFGGHVIKHANIGDVVKDKVPSLKSFLDEGNPSEEYIIPSLAALSTADGLLERYELKSNHGEWVRTVRPDLGPGMAERVWAAVRSTDENVDVCHSVMTESRAALTDLLGDFGVLAMPTVPGDPPKLQTDPTTLEGVHARAFSFLSIAAVSGFCQVSIPLGMCDNLPVSVSLLAKHGSDGFLLNLVETLYDTLKEHVGKL
ncbi:amidase 1-like [Pyrus ussuriensis x Pyrus communis]|uniref:Amidase 1-like n=1 Tax=Pyrus ussuriensis x Pyrus communis TaxID=2448454 RepID=A0A5N5HXE5_9ROSA|nr:amidase 1-like [Pyrus ussuriensis x Pyrus communis]